MNKKCLLDIFKSAIEGVDPYHLVMKKVKVVGRRMTIHGQDYNLGNFNRIVVIGAGKAAAPMARALEEILEDREKLSDWVESAVDASRRAKMAKKK